MKAVDTEMFNGDVEASQELTSGIQCRCNKCRARYRYSPSYTSFISVSFVKQTGIHLLLLT